MARISQPGPVVQVCRALRTALRPHTSVHGRMRMLALLPMVFLVLLVGCGESPPAAAPNHPPDVQSYLVSFAPTVSYAQALRLLTDLGVPPAIDCGTLSGGRARIPWQPMAQRARFLRDTSLLVFPLLSTAPVDWGRRLTSTGVVRSIQPGFPVFPGGIATPPSDLVPYACPAPIGSRAAPPATPVVMANGDDGVAVFARITFAAPLDNYDAAVQLVSDLGLVMTDPCYFNQASRSDAANPPPWHPMGQEATFAAARALLVATTTHFTSTLWRQQLAASPGVATIESPYIAQC